MHMRPYWIPLIFLVLLHSQCQSQKRVKGNRSKSNKSIPSWVLKRPPSDVYYTGIGSAGKENPDYVQIAKQAALTDLSAEIEVTISGVTTIAEIEEDNEFSQRYSALTKSEVENQLTDFEIVDSYETDDRFYIYYRLSKAVYQERKNRLLNRSKREALQLLHLASEKELAGEVLEAMEASVKGLAVLREHLSEDLRIDDGGEVVYLGSELNSRINQLLLEFKIELDPQNLQVQALKRIGDTVRFSVRRQDRTPLVGVPVSTTFLSGSGLVTSDPVSGSTGTGRIIIQRIYGSGLNQQLGVFINLQSFITAGDDAAEILADFLEKKARSAGGVIGISLIPASISVTITDKLEGDVTGPHNLVKDLKTSLVEYPVSWVEDHAEAPFRLEVHFESDKGSFNERHNIYTVFLNSTFQLTDIETGDIIFSKKLENIRGIDRGGYDKAHQEARNMAVNNFKEWLLENDH